MINVFLDQVFNIVHLLSLIYENSDYFQFFIISFAALLLELVFDYFSDEKTI